MLTKTGKENRKRIKKKRFDRMAQDKQELKFERNLQTGFRDNCDMDDGRTTD